MNIGDVFFKARMDGAGLAADAQKQGAKAGTAMGRAASSKFGAEVKKGVGLGAGFAAFNVLGLAVSKVTSYLNDAAQAFRDDQVSVQKLTTALRANVDGWDGNTKAIEAAITERQKLGFSDDAQRSSLAELAAAYGTVNGALEANRIAMDLARFSGVDLAQASDVLIKVHAGNYRALKALGINTANITNETEALAAIQKVASGQAEDFANTLEGRLVVAEVKAEEASEKFGKSVAHLQAVALPAAADAIENIANQLDFLQVSYDDATTEEDKFAAGLAYIKGQGLASLPMFKDLIKAAEDTAAAAEVAAEAEEDHGDALAGVRAEAQDAKRPMDRFAGSMREAAKAAERAEEEVDGLAETIADELFGDAINAGNEAAMKRQIADLIAQRKEAAKGSLEYIELTGEIAETRQALFEYHLTQAAAEGPEAAIRFLQRERAAAGSAKGAIDQLIQRYRILAAMQQVVEPIIRVVSGIYAGRQVPSHYAEGGRYQAGEPRIVGENGPELDIPDHSGVVYPDVMAGASGWGGAPSSNSLSQTFGDITLNVDARGATNPAAVGASVRQGVHDAMADVLRQQTARLPTGTRS